MYVSISMKSYLIWKKTLKLTQIKIRVAKIKVVGPIDVEYSIFKKVLGTSAEVFSFQFMPIRTIFGCQFIFFPTQNNHKSILSPMVWFTDTSAWRG